MSMILRWRSILWWIIIYLLKFWCIRLTFFIFFLHINMFNYICERFYLMNVRSVIMKRCLLHIINWIWVTFIIIIFGLLYCIMQSSIFISKTYIDFFLSIILMIVYILIWRIACTLIIGWLFLWCLFRLYCLSINNFIFVNHIHVRMLLRRAIMIMFNVMSKILELGLTISYRISSWYTHALSIVIS